MKFIRAVDEEAILKVERSVFNELLKYGLNLIRRDRQVDILIPRRPISRIPILLEDIGNKILPIVVKDSVEERSEHAVH